MSDSDIINNFRCISMPRSSSGQKEETTRRRYPSRSVQKGKVSNIASAFKRQMAAQSSDQNENPKNSQTVFTRLRRNSSKSHQLPAPKTKQEKATQRNINVLKKRIAEQINEMEPVMINQHDGKSMNEHQRAEQDYKRQSSETESREGVDASSKEETLNDQLNDSLNLGECNEGNDASFETVEEETMTESADLQVENNVNSDMREKISQKIENGDIEEVLTHLLSKVTSLENAISHPRNGIEPQLAKQTVRIDDLYTDIHSAARGLKVKDSQKEKEMESIKKRLEIIEKNQSRMVSILNENKRLVKELTLMKGMIQKQNQHNAVMEDKWLDLTKRGMEQNLIFYGVEETPDPKEKENCKEKVVQFLQEKMEINIDISQIWKAHRSGYRKPNKVRPIVTKVAYEAKDLIMGNVGKLKDQKNETTDLPLFISEQIPEGIIETKKKINARFQVLKELNDRKSVDQRKEIKVMSNKILVNGKVDTPEVITPQPADLFLCPERQEQVDIMNEYIVETAPIEIKNSVFTGFAVQVDSVQKVQQAYIAVAQRFPSADHIIAAYGLRDMETNSVKLGHADDREYGAGMCIRKTLAAIKAKNTAVFITRQFGGIHLGIERFKTIQKLTEQAVELLNAP